MVTIRLFGLLSDYGGPRVLTVEAKTVSDALNQIALLGVDKDLIRGAQVFVNNCHLKGVRRLSRKLNCGDELVLLSPAGGG